MKCLIEHADGWKEAPAELRPAFDLQERTLRMMMLFGVSWTGMIFTVYREPRPAFRVMLLESDQHIVDVTGHGHDLRIAADD